MATQDDGLSVFLKMRARLFSVAYRIVRSAAAAEDIVQDAWLRWQSTNREAVRDAAAFLTTMTTRLAINVRQSAHSRRETGVEPGLPEPAAPRADHTVHLERADSLTLGVFVLLQRLSPAERAAYVLREGFDCAYSMIARTLDVQEANARQLVRRARVHLAHGPRTQVVAEDHRRLLAVLTVAMQTGDEQCLVDFFAVEAQRIRDERIARRPWDASRANRELKDEMAAEG